MALNHLQQFQELISQANNILVCFKKDYSGDALLGALATTVFLKKMNKNFKIVCDDFKLKQDFSFLVGPDQVAGKLNNLRQLILSLDLKDNELDEFSYEVSDNKLKIYILPKKGELKGENIKSAMSDYFFDLIITVDTQDLESLGELYNHQADFLFTTPIINIDHQLANENFGQLNIVDVNASSTCQVIYELIKSLDTKLIDEETANLLLAGMIHKTQSFKTKNILPQSLSVAAELINYGADREEIVKQFYQTKKISVLKLWGRVLARLEYDKSSKLVWSVLPHIDFVKSGAEAQDLDGVVEEILVSSPQAEKVLLMYEVDEQKIQGKLYALGQSDARYLLNSIEVKGSKDTVEFEIIGKSLMVAEREIVKELVG